MPAQNIFQDIRTQLEAIILKQGALDKQINTMQKELIANDRQIFELLRAMDYKLDKLEKLEKLRSATL